MFKKNTQLLSVQYFILKGPFPDLDSPVNLTVRIGRRRRRRRLPRRRCNPNSVTRNSDPYLRRLQSSHLRFHFRLQINLQRHTTLTLHFISQLAHGGVIESAAGAAAGTLNTHFQKSSIPRTVSKRRNSAVTDGDASVGDDGDGDIVIVENNILVRILRRDVEIDNGGDSIRRSQIKGRNFERRDGEIRSLRTVEEVNDDSSDDDEDNKDENRHRRPYTTRATAGSPVTVATRRRAVSRASGAVYLRFCSGESGICAAVNSAVYGGGFGGGVDSIRHGER